MDNLKKEKQDVRTCSTRYQDNFKTITTKTRVWYKERPLGQRKEPRNRPTHIWTFGFMTKAGQWRKKSLFNKLCWTTGYPYNKNES